MDKHASHLLKTIQSAPAVFPFAGQESLRTGSGHPMWRPLHLPCPPAMHVHEAAIARVQSEPTSDADASFVRTRGTSEPPKRHVLSAQSGTAGLRAAAHPGAPLNAALVNGMRKSTSSSSDCLPQLHHLLAGWRKCTAAFENATSLLSNISRY